MKPVAQAQRSDGLPHEHRGVRRPDRILGRDGQLVLRAAVLRMDLIDRHALLVEGDQQVPQVVGALDQPGVPVGRTGGGRREVGFGRGHCPLDLERRLHRVAGVGEVSHGRLGEAALILRMHGSVLLIAPGRRPRPAGLLREHRDSRQVGMQPQVPHRTAGVPSGHDPVVGQEGVEHRGRADAPRGRRLQPAERHGLDAGHAAVVHPRHADSDHPAVGQIALHLPGESRLPFPIGLIHRGSARSSRQRGAMLRPRTERAGGTT